MIIRLRAAAFFCIVAFAAVVSTAQTTRPADTGIDKIYLQAHFTKAEYRVPMRDGVHLHTAVYVPKAGPGKYPVVFIRTPYGVGGYGANEWPDPKAELKWFGREPFIFALQDVRGRFHSEGAFLHVRPIGAGAADDSTDAYDTIDWLSKNLPQSTGRVAQVGMSYPGYYTLAGMINAHPALKCAIPQAPVGDWFLGDDVHHNGALALAPSYLFLRYVGGATEPMPTPDGYDFFLKLGAAGNARGIDGKTGFWDDVMSHGTYDAWWKARDVRPHLHDIHVPTLVVGGWFDAEDLFGTLAAYHGVERNNPGTENTLVMGPWSHGLWIRSDGESLGDVHFGAKTAEWYRAAIELPFLKHHLTSDGPGGTLAEAVVFETGANVWRRFAAWPPTDAEERELHLGEHGRLSFDATVNDAQFDEYVSDPARPVPYTSNITMSVPKEYMSADQRFASERPDVLVYQTEPLPDDLRLAGPVGVDLRVSTTGTDSDWVVKLIDVYPDSEKDPDPNTTSVHLGGYQQLVRGDIMRGKFREGFDKQVPFTPGQVTPLKFDMPDVCHTFKRGHRMMIQIQSSWFPLFDRNPQTLCDIYHAKPADYRKATQRIYHNSVIRVGVLPNIRG